MGDTYLTREGLVKLQAEHKALMHQKRQVTEEVSKAAALGHSLVSNHPFIDGNKRVGFEAMRLMLRLNGHDIHASTNTKYAFIMDMAKGKLTEQAIADWLKQHSQPYRKG